MESDKVKFWHPVRWTRSVWQFALVLMSLAIFLPGFFSIPPIDRDETRFSQSTRQMVASGDYIDIRFHDGTRYKKPIGIYWLQAASVSAVNAITGSNDAPIWAYRIPSLVGAVLSVLLTFWIAQAFFPPFYAGLAACLLMASILLGVEARIAKTDAFLLATILVAQGLLARAWLNERALGRIELFGFWGAIGAGILLKGPIILMVTGLTAISLAIVGRSLTVLKNLRPAIGILITLVIAVPWFVAIGIKSDGAFFIEAGLVDFLAKVASVKESHGGPPGIYAALMIAIFWPASLFFFAGLPTILTNLKSKAAIFALCWAVPSWIIFELTSTKLPHYVLPLYPALALLIALAFEKGIKGSALWVRVLTALWFVAPFILGLTAFGGLIYLEGVIDPFIVLATGLATVLGVVAWRVFAQPGLAAASVAFMIGTAFCLYVALYEFAFPKVQTIWISDRLVAMLDRHGLNDDCPEPAIMSVGYNEPSLAFLGPLNLRFKNTQEAIDLMKENSCRQVFVVNYLEADFQKLAGEQELALRAVDQLDGFKLNGGDEISVTLYESSQNSSSETADGVNE